MDPNATLSELRETMAKLKDILNPPAFLSGGKTAAVVSLADRAWQQFEELAAEDDLSPPFLRGDIVRVADDIGKEDQFGPDPWMRRRGKLGIVLDSWESDDPFLSVSGSVPVSLDGEECEVVVFRSESLTIVARASEALRDG